MSNSVDTIFPITVYGNLEKFSDTISLGRCRIFYKYGNRNGSYITDEFAESLIQTLPYTPVKGIYDEDTGDYADHGADRTLGRIYGIVPGPQDMGFAWEKHVDEDGVEREYACVNVYYYTALYEEAGDIAGKGQSMELYRKSIDGSWKIIDGKQYYVFEKGCFLGLQVLGDDVEPCFEGAAFFSLYQSVKEMCDKLEQYQQNFQNHGEGEKPMQDINFKISDREKHEWLWTLLNTNFNEENGWVIEYCICEVYDDYAIVMNHAEGIYERVYYVKNDETDSMEITKRERCYIVDVNEEEKAAVDAIQKDNGSFSAFVEKFASIGETAVAIAAELEAAKEEISKFSTQNEELNGQITTLIQEKEEAITLHTSVSEELAALAEKFSALEASFAQLTEVNEALATYKKNVEDAEKMTVINGYADQLSSEIIDQYTENKDNYTAEELDMKLTYELKKSHPEVFSKGTPPAYVPKDFGPEGGLTTILAKYSKK